jgi:hypothetical protein
VAAISVGVREMGRRPKRPWSDEEDERLRQLAAQSLSRHAIAVQLGSR